METPKMDSTVALGALMGADVLLDRRDRCIHTFNDKATDAVAKLRRAMEDKPDTDDNMIEFLYALDAQGFTLAGISEDGVLVRLVKPSDLQREDDEGTG